MRGSGSGSTQRVFAKRVISNRVKNPLSVAKTVAGTATTTTSERPVAGDEAESVEATEAAMASPAPNSVGWYILEGYPWWPVFVCDQFKLRPKLHFLGEFDVARRGN